MTTVAHCVSAYLPITCTWIYSQLCYMTRYRAVVFANGILNRDQFPFDPVYSFTLLGPARKNLNRAVRHLTEQHLPLFRRTMREEGVGLIHAHFGDEGYRWLWTQGGLNVPLVVTFYGFDVSRLGRSPRWQARFRRLFSRGSLFLCEGPRMRDAVVNLGCDPAKVVVQHLGIDVQTIPYIPRTMPQTGPVELLMAATFREKKGISYALEAVARLTANHNVHLTIVGDGELRPEIERQIEGLGVGSKVTLLGYQPHQTLFDVAKSAHIFLSPSVTAANGDSEGGAPVVLLEMQAMGLPVVGTVHADIPEVTLNGQSAILVNERDAQGIEEAVERLLRHPETWASMGAAGREHVNRHFRIEDQASRLEGLYDEILRKHNTC
jgi:colanic acid/amylovoran biosynthesis glycosyltransferase